MDTNGAVDVRQHGLEDKRLLAGYFIVPGRISNGDHCRNLVPDQHRKGLFMADDRTLEDPGFASSTTLWRGVAIGLTLRDERRDYLSGVTVFRTAVPSSFACSSMAASCFFTYSD
jgi:hypothetical protein